MISKVNSRSESIKTLVATVELEPTAGSVYSGVIKEYRDVRGFILLEAPRQIRILGQAPVVRSTLFDMVSDGREFRLWIPPKNKFIVGKSDLRRAAKNSFENLRPQHILDALLVPGINSRKERYVTEESEVDAQRFYVITVVEPAEGRELALRRKIWFERANLDLARLQLYGPHGRYLEDVHYAAYQDFGGVNFPSRIEIARPVEDYSLVIRVEKAVFNQPIAADKFEMKLPEGAELVELANDAEKGDGNDQ
ncbi:MAG: DUF4292 domain-containing protein [Acidobacteria bacterium]|nr:DUF4292 domain-containing protein [Acidobacteriota bacterium]